MAQSTELTTHDADLTQIVDLLETRRARAVDVVAPLTAIDAEKTVKAVARKFAFSEEQRANILTQFIRGGQATAGGVMQAVTAEARVVREIKGDPDTAADMEALAVPVLRYAAAGAR